MRFNVPPLNPTPQRILMVRLSAHGDIVQSFPVLKALRARFPHAQIGWVVSEAGAPLLEVVKPWLNAVHVLPASYSKEMPKVLLGLKKPSPALREALWHIQRESYEVAIDVQGLAKSAIIPALLRIPNRLGYANAREKAWLFYTHTPAHLGSLQAPQGHASQEFCRLLRPFGEASQAAPPLTQLPDFSPNNANRDVMQSVHQGKAAGYRLLGFAPFTMWPSKHWPLQHWRTLIQKSLEQRPDALLACIGSPADVPNWEALTAPLPATLKSRLIMAAGKTSLPGLFHLLREVDVFVGADSAPLHMMDFLIQEGLNPWGKTVAVMGPTHPVRTGAQNARARNLVASLPCMPCHRRRCPLGSTACMAAVSVEQVLDAIGAQGLGAL